MSNSNTSTDTTGAHHFVSSMVYVVLHIEPEQFCMMDGCPNKSTIALAQHLDMQWLFEPLCPIHGYAESSMYGSRSEFLSIRRFVAMQLHTEDLESIIIGDRCSAKKARSAGYTRPKPPKPFADMTTYAAVHIAPYCWPGVCGEQQFFVVWSYDTQKFSFHPLGSKKDEEGHE